MIFSDEFLNFRMMLAIFYLISSVFCLVILWFLWKRRRFYLLHSKIPGRWGYPLIGLAHLVSDREEVLQVVEEHLKKYGPLMLAWLGPLPVLLTSEPQTIKDVLMDQNTKKGSFYSSLDDGVGHGLFSMDGAEWSRHRRLLNPCFNPKVLNSFIPIFNHETSSLVDILKKRIDGEAFDLNEILQVFSMNTAAKTTLGTNLDSQHALIKEHLVNSFHCILEVMVEMMIRPWLRIKALRFFYHRFRQYEKCKLHVRAIVHKISYLKFLEASIINSESEEEEYAKANHNLFIDFVLERHNDGDFTWQNLQDHCLSMMTGAFETIASTIFHTLMLLAMFPQYDEKLFDEIHNIMQEKDDDDEVSNADVQRMPYLDMVINEAMRVLPTVPIVARELCSDLRLSNGIVVPKGVLVMICVFHLHRSKEIWGPDAHTFNPDHFHPSNMENKHPFAFIPFMKGIRNCIGWRYALLAMKVTLAKVLWKYRFTTDFKFQNLHFVEDITLKFKELPLLKVHRRNDFTMD